MIDYVKRQDGYELLDSGDGEKLERFGEYVLRRPDPQALWQKINPEIWSRADASFVREGSSGKWQCKNNLPKEWNINFGGLMLKISPTPFKHTGLFPEQLTNWMWMENILKEYQKIHKKEAKVLNLFGYTGGASLVCAKAGAHVCHIDASKSAITWARYNAELSALKDCSIRWILEDAFDFVRKEIKRGQKYDAIVMDPPAFGHGPSGQLWRIEEMFVEFVDSVKKLLSDNPAFFVINGYSSGYSSVAYKQNMLDLLSRFGGSIDNGEIFIEEKSGRVLPCGISARWSFVS